MGESKKDAEAQKRSEAAKKAAATRKANQEAEAKGQSSGQSTSPPEPHTAEEPQEKADRGDDQIPAKFRRENLDVDRSQWAARREPTPEERMAELEEAQRVHAQRTGGGEVLENELVAQLEAHNERTGDVSR
jgi:hypothetical protein